MKKKCTKQISNARASAEKFPGGGGERKKTRPKISTTKPFSILSVPCMKIQGGHDSLCSPAADAHAQMKDNLLKKTSDAEYALVN